MVDSNIYSIRKAHVSNAVLYRKINVRWIWFLKMAIRKIKR